MTRNITVLWDALGWAILHSLWQGAAIGLIVWMVRVLATDRRAWLRYLAGMGGLIATFAAFITTFTLLLFNRANGAASAAFATETQPGAANDVSLSWAALPTQFAQTEVNSAGLTMGSMAELIVPWLGVLWAVGFAFLSVQAYRAFANTRWLATQGSNTPNADWTTRFATLVQHSRTHARVRLLISEHVNGPMTLGALRPIVLVPIGFLTALPPAQVEAILLHELAHIRRHDFFFGLIQTAIRTALYFNPAVIMISRQIDEDREKACDDIAVRISGNPGDLVRGLAALRLGHQAPAMAMAADGGPLLARLNRLMGRPATRQATNRLSAAAVSVLLLGTAACSTVSMANPPAPPVAPQATLPDTVVRAGPSEAPRVYRMNSPETPSVPSPSAIPPTLALPPVPAMPPVPTIPPVPNVPAPVFSDYDDEDAFEAAMEAWAEQMDVWGADVERRFEGEWEDKMASWSEELEDWVKNVEVLTEQYNGVAAIDPADYKTKAETIRLVALRQAATERHQVSTKRRMAAALEHEASEQRRAKADARRALADSEHAKADARRALADAEHAKADARRAIADAERAKSDKRRAKSQAEREQAEAERRVARQERKLELKRRQIEKQAREVERQNRDVKVNSARHDSHTRSHTQQKITVTSDEPGSTVVINGKTVDVDGFRAKIMGALVEDGFISARNQPVTVMLSGDDLEVNGRSGTPAQAKRYSAMVKSEGFDTNGSIVLDLDLTQMSIALSHNVETNP